MTSALRRISSRSRVTSPRTRIASPGPGKGCRPIIFSGRPSVRPTSRTSSLNNSRNGSTSFKFIFSGSPPTLWWVLMVAEGPLNDIDSMTSGYNVPCARKETPSTFFASFSKISINVFPIILRFCSGSITPRSRSRKRLDPSTKSSAI